MSSSDSNFKRRLRLPRLFFRKPTEAERVHGGPPFNFERPIPAMPWARIVLGVALVTVAASFAWELYCRSIGYRPCLNDNDDLWSLTRRKVKPESLVLIGDSTGTLDFDLDELEKGLGQRPIQLSAAGVCALPILTDLANDQSYHGIIICSIIPAFFFAPPDSSPLKHGERIVKRFHNQTPAQRWGEYLAMALEEHVAFLKAGEVDLGELLKRLPIPNRPGVRAPPPFIRYFATLDRERRMRMTESCADPNGDVAKQLRQAAFRFLTPGRPSNFSNEEWYAKMREALITRFHDATDAVERLRARGGKVVFVRCPVSGDLRLLESRFAHRYKRWDPLLQMTHTPGIYYSDFPELSDFNCPDWTHLSVPDSIEFSKRLVPHLRTALGMSATP